MDIRIKQSLKIGHQLVITPQLHQAIKILQLTHVELCQEIKDQLYENPCLEELEGTAPEDDLLQFLTSARENTRDHLALSDIESREGSGSYEKFLSKTESLSDYLMWQLSHLTLSPEEQQISKFIVGNLDDNGFLTMDFEAIAGACESFRNIVEKVLHLIQNLDPVGVGARNLQECLLIQLKALDDSQASVSLAISILDQCFDFFIQRKTKEIAKMLKIPLDVVASVYQVIAQLNPKPGSGFRAYSSYHEELRPDVFVYPVGGEFVVQLNDSGMPRLRVSRSYLELLSRNGAPSEVEYIRERIKSAVFFIKSIDQRNNTLFRVSKSILQFQQDFFSFGPKCLKPLVLKEVALDVGLHESTVSRVTRGKFMQTPFGIMELKYFFNSGLATAQDEIASKSVKHLIAEMIQKEDATHPLSDQSICALLGEKNIQIARRTVAKYREALHILSSSARRKKF